MGGLRAWASASHLPAGHLKSCGGFFPSTIFSPPSSTRTSPPLSSPLKSRLRLTFLLHLLISRLPSAPPPSHVPSSAFLNTCPFTTLPLRFPHFSLPQRCYPFKEEAPCLHGRNVAHLEIHTFCYLRTLRYTCAKRHETRVHWPKGIFFITHVRNPPLKTRGENTGNVEVNIVLAYHVKFKVPSRL